MITVRVLGVRARKLHRYQLLTPKDQRHAWTQTRDVCVGCVGREGCTRRDTSYCSPSSLVFAFLSPLLHTLPPLQLLQGMGSQEAWPDPSWYS